MRELPLLRLVNDRRKYTSYASRAILAAAVTAVVVALSDVFCLGINHSLSPLQINPRIR